MKTEVIVGVDIRHLWEACKLNICSTPRNCYHFSTCIDRNAHNQYFSLNPTSSLIMMFCKEFFQINFRSEKWYGLLDIESFYQNEKILFQLSEEAF